MTLKVDGNNTKLSSICPEGDALEEFKRFLLDHDRKVRTIHRHLWNINLILQNAPNFTKSEIDSWFSLLKERGCKNTYLNSLISSVRQYAQFLQDSEELQKYKFKKKEHFSKATMSDEEIEAFLSLSSPQITIPHRNGKMITRPANSKLYHKWTVFFSIMAFSGMRPGEVAQLKVEDVDFGRQVFVIRDSKTNTPRVAPIAPNILTMIQSYLPTLTGELLFPSSNGGNKDGVTPVFDNVDWHYNFHTRLKRLGIKRTNLTPYSLRHSYATRLLESDVSLFHVKKLMGHHDLKSTLVYEHLTTADLIKAVEKLPLVRRGTDPKTILQALCEVIKNFHIEKDSRFRYTLSEDQTSIKFECYIAQAQRD